MKINNEWKDYQILATGNGEKLERWKDVYLLRPDPQAIWKSQSNLSKFGKLNARYIRSETGGGHWEYLKQLPESWIVGWRDLRFRVKPMGFKHTGLFPEQAVNWAKMIDLIKNANRQINVLNLFAYTGGATVACLSAGAHVCHVDAAKNMVERAKENVSLSGIGFERSRFIVDDCKKFVTREIKRGKKYDAIILDPPSYGRGANGEIWKIENDLYDFVELCTGVLSDNPLFVLINSYTTGLQPAVLNNILKMTMRDYKGSI
ncbi:MAG: class I SAM-dependent methyltransferase, partial [Clostridia bacterium]|nr:class I SAM-dependent methyltransferase [Clostridia bacterium]